jgi:hypothetical protein
LVEQPLLAERLAIFHPEKRAGQELKKGDKNKRTFGVFNFKNMLPICRPLELSADWLNR